MLLQPMLLSPMLLSVLLDFAKLSEILRLKINAAPRVYPKCQKSGARWGRIISYTSHSQSHIER